MTATLPPNATSAAIGKVVAIQIFQSSNGHIHEETMEKHVGILEAFWWTKGLFSFRLRGGKDIVTMTKTHHLEIFPLKEEDVVITMDRSSARRPN